MIFHLVGHKFSAKRCIILGVTIVLSVTTKIFSDIEIFKKMYEKIKYNRIN